MHKQRDEQGRSKGLVRRLIKPGRGVTLKRKTVTASYSAADNPGLLLTVSRAAVGKEDPNDA